MLKSERNCVEFTDEERAEIRRLLEKAMAELEHGNLNQAHEALLVARHTYEQLAAQIAKWAGLHDNEQQVFTLQLAQALQAIARSERRLAAYVIE